ncbi:MAG: ATP-binding protein, partial [Pseudomonadota bacterium]
MKNTVNKSEAVTHLRQKAEELLKKTPLEQGSQLSEADTLKLIHELQVHQIELELQNEELMLAKELAEAASDKYIELYDFAPSGYCTLTKEGKIIELNLRGSQMLGKERSRLINSSLGFFISDDTKPAFNLFLEKVFKSKAKESCDVTLTGNGSLPMYAHLSGLVTENGEQCLVTILDITERKEAEAAILQAKNDWEDTFNSITDIITIHDRDFNVIRANKAAEKLGWTSFPGEEKQNVKCFKFYHGTDKPPHGCPSCNCLETGIPSVFEAFEPSLNKHIEIRAIPRLDSNNHLTGSTHIVRDITERKQAEEERLKLEQQLLQSQKMEAIGTLAGGIAHDFNNILAGIIGFGEIAKDKLAQDSQSVHYLDQILKLGDRAAKLVQQILVFSRKTDSKRSPLQLSPLIKEVLTLLRETFPATIEIRQKLFDQGSVVEANPTQIHQVLMNLCTNAFMAMQGKDGVLEVELTRVSLSREDIASYKDIEPGPYVLLKISDTGTGIDPAIISRIFDPFFTTKGVGKGTGLGLSVVHGIIKAHGGDITVASEPGKGATFSILLPEVSTPAEIEQEENNCKLLTGSEHILFVDDEEALIGLVKELLEPLGYTVTAVQSGREALALFQKAPEKFDLVITDLSMPHMSGYELAQKLIGFKPGIPVILCTGYNETMLDNKEKEHDIKAVLIKPYKRKALAEAVRKVL